MRTKRLDQFYYLRELLDKHSIIKKAREEDNIFYISPWKGQNTIFTIDSLKNVNIYDIPMKNFNRHIKTIYNCNIKSVLSTDCCLLKRKINYRISGIPTLIVIALSTKDLLSLSVDITIGVKEDFITSYIIGDELCVELAKSFIYNKENQIIDYIIDKQLKEFEGIF